MDAEQTHRLASSYLFLGVFYTHSPGFVSTAIGERSLKKLKFFDSQDFDDEAFTLRCAMRWFSLLLWGARILGMELCSMYHLLKFFRRRASIAFPLDRNPLVWPCLRSFWRTLHANICRNMPFQRRALFAQTSHTTVTLFSDSSLDGWGVILIINNKRFLCDCGKWNVSEPIMILEARALLRGLRFLETLGLDNIILHIKVDNTSLYHSIQNAHSRNFLLNHLSGLILQHVRNLSIISWTISWVETTRMIADAASRIFSESC